MNQDPKGMPSTSKTAFDCPHCSAYTTQYWSTLYANRYKRTPNIPIQREKQGREEDPKMTSNEIKELIECTAEMYKGKPFPVTQNSSKYVEINIQNLNISTCYNCKEISIWVYDQIVYPSTKIDVKPNQDLPSNIAKLFEEAREIAGSSPRGAAALLRLSIQYLCKELGETGKDINKDIASLVSKGLHPLVQKALDVVRVIGNEAVHPGEINLEDNHDTVLQLFDIINLIAGQMITHPKQVEEMYVGLPANKLQGIEQRDKKATESNEGT